LAWNPLASHTQPSFFFSFCHFQDGRFPLPYQRLERAQCCLHGPCVQGRMRRIWC
jgi:hypothetical protein